MVRPLQEPSLPIVMISHGCAKVIIEEKDHFISTLESPVCLEGEQRANYYGSLTQSTTIRLGSNNDGKEVHIPFNTILPMLHPNDIVIGGWDINNVNLYDAMRRACVFDYELQEKLKGKMSQLKPLPSIYYPDFIAANQEDRANNLIPTGTKQQDLEHIRNDIRKFKAANNLEQVIVLWTANTERYVDGKHFFHRSSLSILDLLSYSSTRFKSNE